MSFIVYIAGFFVLIILFKYAASVYILQGVRIRRGRYTLADEAGLPDHLSAAFEPYAKGIADLGFVFSHVQKVENIFASDPEARWSTVYVHLAEKTYATIAQTPLLEHADPCVVEFFTQFADGHVLLTVNGIAHALVGDFAGTTLVDPYAESMEKQWRAHTEALLRLRDSRQAVVLTKEEFVAVMQKRIDDFITGLEAGGRVRPAGESLWAFTLSSSVRLTQKILQGRQKVADMMRRRMIALKKQNMWPEKAGYPVEIDVSRFTQARSLTKMRKMGWIGKALLFVVSLVLFALVFGVAFSFRFLLLIVLALLVHESGHILGMFLFGYRDLKILFLPFLGAVALGERKDARAWQKAVIYLLGPAPGILIGVVMLVMGASSPLPFYREAGIVFLVLNIFNMIPLMPFDGGHLFNLVLWQRIPFLQAAFLALSAAVLAAAGLYTRDQVLVIIGFFLLIGLPAQIANIRANAMLKKRFREKGRPATEEALIGEVFLVLREKPFLSMPFEKKHHLTRHLVENASTETPSWEVTVLALVLYFSVLFVLPLGVFLAAIVFKIFTG